MAPKVIIDPAPSLAPFGALFGRGLFDMSRQIDAMMREIGAIARQPIAAVPGMNVAAYGNVPAGSRSVTIVTTSDGARTCTRTTEAVSQGPGKAPKVTTSTSGDCSTAAPAPPSPSS